MTGHIASLDLVLGISCKSVGSERTGGMVTTKAVTTEVAAPELGDADMVRTQLEKLAAELGFSLRQRKNGRITLTSADGGRVAPWQENYPYPDRLGRKPYERAKRM